MKKGSPEIIVWRNLLAYSAEVIYKIERELKMAKAIPLASYDILIELETAPEKKLRLFDLAQACILTKSGISKIINTLEAQELLYREKCADDKRGFFAVISPKGRYAVRKAWIVYKKCIEIFFETTLNDTELKQLGIILTKLRKNLHGSFMATACQE